MVLKTQHPQRYDAETARNLASICKIWDEHDIEDQYKGQQSHLQLYSTSLSEEENSSWRKILGLQCVWESLHALFIS